jgi:hypothetical protein
MEQVLGRTHREGQEADHVQYDFLVGCGETLKGLARAVSGARMIEGTTGLGQKLTSACDLVVPDARREGPRFQGAPDLGMAIALED